MISLEQVLLLEQKVEGAVAKIAQLNAENAALRSRCAELTNALSAKTEQFSSFQSDQNKIEEGILKALQQLNTVENTVLSINNPEVGQVPASAEAASIETANVESDAETQQSESVQPVEEEVSNQEPASSVTQQIPTSADESDAGQAEISPEGAGSQAAVQAQANVQSVQLNQIYESTQEPAADNSQDGQSGDSTRQELFDIF
ncbi:MAG: cell division protein ZapB [Treponemataceae bacterium]|nr:cell division protein ZapB [Treponemataceae bacterium]